MIHEPESGADTWQPCNAVRLFELFEQAGAALGPLPGWPPPVFESDEPDATNLSTIESLRIDRAALAASLGPPSVTPVTPWEDNIAKELTDLARAGDAPGFRRLAACVMPVEEIDECWAGTRGRLGLNDADP
ncbi:MAG: hypothetical protein Q8R92_06820 [Deltaproteobacteria bacterium]|nr:hypothetical protein [Deltaproteobacteria bacterium]